METHETLTEYNKWIQLQHFSLETAPFSCPDVVQLCCPENLIG